MSPGSITKHLSRVARVGCTPHITESATAAVHGMIPTFMRANSHLNRVAARNVGTAEVILATTTVMTINRDANADNRKVWTCLGFSRLLPHQFDDLSELTVGTANKVT